MLSDFMPILDKIKSGDRDVAHRLIQEHSDLLACRIHAYPHRQEGHLGNAAYWYAILEYTDAQRQFS